MKDWTAWRPFPDPRKLKYLVSPFGPGIYELRDRRSSARVLVGSGKNCAFRLSSLLPAPLGQGTRNNSEKRDHVLQNLKDIEYRTRACASVVEARSAERLLRRSRRYLFGT